VAAAAAAGRCAAVGTAVRGARRRVAVAVAAGRVRVEPRERVGNPVGDGRRRRGGRRRRRHPPIDRVDAVGATARTPPVDRVAPPAAARRRGGGWPAVGPVLLLGRGRLDGDDV